MPHGRIAPAGDRLQAVTSPLIHAPAFTAIINLLCTQPRSQQQSPTHLHAAGEGLGGQQQRGVKVVAHGGRAWEVKVNDVTLAPFEEVLGAQQVPHVVAQLVVADLRG